jgi:hypothetical protein
MDKGNKYFLKCIVLTDYSITIVYGYIIGNGMSDSYSSAELIINSCIQPKNDIAFLISDKSR